MTIHYWIRYTRFRIPIAESFRAPRPRPRPRALAYAVSLRIVSTNKHANTHGPRVERPARVRSRPVIRTCTYTSPRNKPDTEGKGGSRRCVCLENKNASCVRNLYTQLTRDSPLLAATVALYPPLVHSRPLPRLPLPCPATGNPRSLASVRRSRIFLPAFETSPACGFFVSSYIWYRNILAIVPTSP